jgi:hypothetical protein
MAGKRDTFDDWCEPCITTQWCSWHGGCLAERLPTDRDKGLQQWVRHLPECVIAINTSERMRVTPERCTCGLEAALQKRGL